MHAYHYGDSEGVLEQAKSGVRADVASAAGDKHVRDPRFMDGELRAFTKGG